MVGSLSSAQTLSDRGWGNLNEVKAPLRAGEFPRYEGIGDDDTKVGSALTWRRGRAYEHRPLALAGQAINHQQSCCQL